MKADLILKNAWVFRTYRQCFEKMDIAVAGDRFCRISPARLIDGGDPYAECAGDCCAEKVIDCTGKYVIPGLVDIHMHIESSMTYPQEFSDTVLPYGVTTVVADPHEIANVFGMEGIRHFMDQKTDLDIFYGIPSSVPATRPEMETSGGIIGEAQVRELLRDERVICLGEVMNYKDLVSEESTETKRLIEVCRGDKRHIRIEGHCPALTDGELADFIAAGVDADHTEQTAESVVEKTDMGMFLELQEKSLKYEVIEVVERFGLYENVALVTDDTMPDHLMEGQLNRILKLAVSAGMPAEKAVYCATFTPARRMQLYDRGMIAPGKLADFVILEDLETFSPVAVYKNGKRYEREAGRENGRLPKNPFPDSFYQSVKCRLAVASDFVLPLHEFLPVKTTEGGETEAGELPTEYLPVNGTVVAHVMQIQTFGTRAKHVMREVPVKEGRLCWQEAGLCLAAIFERYGKNGSVSYGFVEHGLKESGAVATTWSHDSHNLLVLGNSVEDMVLAQNEVVHMQGGYVVCSGNRVEAAAGLPIGGIISDQKLEVLAEEMRAVRAAIEKLGYVNNNCIMSISTLSLLVSPELKLSDQGLFDVKTQQKVPLVS